MEGLPTSLRALESLVSSEREIKEEKPISRKKRRVIELESEDEAVSEKKPSEAEICAICLSECEDPAFVDTCFHTFCFVCIVQWSAIGEIPRCPLCKQQFTSVVHNVVSETEFKRHFVRNLEGRPLQSLSRTPQLNTPRRGWGIPQRPNYSDPSNIPFSTSHSLRRGVYLRKLRAIPFGNVSERLSLHSYQGNPSRWDSKLKPWITRELQALLEEEDVDIIVMLVLSLLKQYGLHSDHTASHLREWLGDNTAPFLHELEVFANSPHSMYTYDRSVRYEPSSRGKKEKRKREKKEKNEKREYIDLSKPDTIDLIDLSSEDNCSNPVHSSIEFRRLKKRLGDVDDAIFALEKEKEEVEEDLRYLHKKLPKLIAKAQRYR